MPNPLGIFRWSRVAASDAKGGHEQTQQRKSQRRQLCRNLHGSLCAKGTSLFGRQNYAIRSARAHPSYVA